MNRRLLMVIVTLMLFVFAPVCGSASESQGSPDQAASARSKAADAKKAKKTAKTGTATAREAGFTEPLTGMAFVFVKGGCFQMGDVFGDGESNEKPVHKVCVDDFYMGKYEVTQKQWQAVMGNDPSQHGKSDQYPVDSVSWHDAHDFIAKLTQKADGKKFRLPTEAEWEYAARSGGKQEKYAGFSDDSRIFRYGNFCDAACELKTKTESQHDGYQNTAPVGSYQPNGLGLYDMTGNVWEWCEDWYRNDYYQGAPAKNPRGPERDTSRVLRGGSWGSIPAYVRTTNRGFSTPEYRDTYIGFRLVLPLK